MATNIPTIGCEPTYSTALEEITQFRWPSGFSVVEIPSPQRIAPFSVALEAEVTQNQVEVSSGRFILLHDPVGEQTWEGTFRCVTFIQAAVEYEMASDPLMAEVGWSWLTDALAKANAAHTNASGTVTCVSSRGFGAMAADPDRAEIEIRASWTALLDETHGIKEHLKVWQDLLCATGGIEELPQGVVQLGNRTRL